jgi:diguanylate cyclase (GGDEF)-like protein
MPPAQFPSNEAERLAELREYEILDTACEENFDIITRLAVRLTGCPIALVSLMDEERQWFKARHGLDVVETPRDQAFCAHAILEPSRPLVVPDATKDPRFQDNTLVTGDLKIRFYAGVPLVNPHGYALGTLCVMDREPRQLDQEEFAALVELAQFVTTALELRRAMRQMRTMALTDTLTGLPNRAAFLNALGQTVTRHRRDGRPFALLYVDLDGLKQVNGLYGHQIGDRVLKAAATSLRLSMRNEDTVARIGGDEFGAILVGGDGSEGALIAERVRGTVHDRMISHSWNVTVSIGAVAFTDGPIGESEALAAAEEMIYEAKSAGRNRVVCLDYSNGGSRRRGSRSRPVLVHSV